MLSKLKNKWKNDKSFRHMLCTLFLAGGVAATGLTLAWLTSHDSSTNRALSDYSNPVEIKITEPRWDSVGEVDAKRFVAGMEIEKDPYATNYMAADVYLRMKITVYNSDNKEVTLGDGESLELVKYDSNKEHLTNDYSAFLSTIYNDKTQLLSANNGTAASNNTYFYYSDGWFYYTGDSDSLKSLTYEETTAVPLFTSIKLPVFDSEYDLFKSGFKIKITAEAVDVAEFVDDADNKTTSVTDADSLANIKAVFGEGTALNENTSYERYDDDAVMNTFNPGEVSVSVKENDSTVKQTGDNTLNWTLDDTTYTANKKVQIHCNDTETDYTSCYVRVCLLPKRNTTVGSEAVEVLDNETGNDITFPGTITGNTFKIDGITFTLADNWSENWIYKGGYFYYKKALSTGEDTEPLLESVSAEKSDLDAHKANGESLGVSVLTDAIQSKGGAVSLKWNASLDSGKITKIN